MSKSAVPQGYRRTEAGIIPKDWDVLKFSDIAVLKKDRIDPRRTQGGQFCIELEHISQGGGRLLGSTETTQQSSLKSVFKEGDILFGKLRAYLRKYLVANQDGVCSTEIWVMTPKDGKTLSPYLYQIVQTNGFIELASLAYGTHMPRSDWKVVGNMPVGLPSPKEQQRIAQALVDLDALILSQEQLIAKKRDIKLATMQQLLTGLTRLPGFHKKWTLVKLGNIANIQTGKRNNEDKSEDGVYPFFVRSQTVEQINTYSYDGEAILIPGEGGIGTIFHYINGKFDFHQRVYKISDFCDDACGKFVYYTMAHNFHKQATRNSVKATVDSLRRPTFTEFELLLPVLGEQKAIADILTNMDLEIAAVETECNKTKALKQGMMQELLTGRTRLI